MPNRHGARAVRATAPAAARKRANAPQAGRRLLAARLRAAPALVRRAVGLPIPALPFLPAAARAILVTGIGSSAAHAKLLVHLLADRLGLPARFAPPGAFVDARPERHRDVLIVFSQGLSPNARLALHGCERWLGVVLVTGAGARASRPDAGAVLRAVRSARGLIVPLPGGAERGLLLRVAGPLAGYAVAYRLAAAHARALGVDDTELRLDAPRIERAMRAAAARMARLRSDWLAADLALLATGGYGELADNLALKLGEALFLPQPPVWDLIGFAHGPFQQLYGRRTTLLALTRRGAPGDAMLLARAQRMLDRRRHRVLRVPATLPGALALFEHEAALNALVARAIDEWGIDQATWPGRRLDGPLYGIASPARDGAARRRSRTSSERSLADLTWPELDAALAAGRDTAVLPLGATEQHGPHLPFATDTWIADALAERFCARVPEAVRLPALPFGCSAEHGGFPGTLTLRWQSLRAVLTDLVASLARHGFRRVVIFSAHGGNDAVLRESVPALSAAACPAELLAFSGIDALALRWLRASAAHGVPAAAAGHHAGEFETSIVLGLRPAAVRIDALRAGRLVRGNEAQDIFYPSLRTHAPSGVVGDPRAANGVRAGAYLDAWVEALLMRYARAKKRQNAKGTQKP
ncbi:MAG: creatininase family protein [Candidatus Binatia bacterium]